MAVLETFLLDKLLHKLTAIKEAAKSSTHSTPLTPDFSQPETVCRELKRLMEERAKEVDFVFDPNIKEKLFSLNNLVLPLKTRRSVSSLHTSLEELKKDLDLIGPRNRPSDPPPGQDKIYGLSTRLTPPSPKIYGLKDRAMERMLVRTESIDGHKAVGLVGMAGVGKTTLCQVAFDNWQVKRHFLPMMWVCLSKQPKEDPDYRKEVVKRILTCLGFEDGIVHGIGGGGTRRLLFAVRKQLKGKRYLIVLDGVWSSEKEVRSFCSVSSSGDKDGDKLSYGLPRGNGETVIASSRWRELAEDIVGEKNIHTLLPVVGTESCWEILMGAAKGDGPGPLEEPKEPKDRDGTGPLEEPKEPKDRDGTGTLEEPKEPKDRDGTGPLKELEELKVTIVKNCGGLPLVAKMMGQIVHEKIQQREMTKSETTKPKED